jgi:transketolase
MPVQTYEIEEKPKMGSCRFAANDKLFELARKDSDVVLITLDNTSAGSPQEKFWEEFGERFIDCGIAEQNGAGMAAGLALSGKKVYCQSFACFLSLRSLEFIYLDAAYNNASVMFMGTHSGVTAPSSGPTHAALMDIGYMRAMPNMTVIVPSDPKISVKVMEASLNYAGPIYFRLAKGMEPLVYKEDIQDFEIGKGILIRKGKDITLIGCGCGVYQCVKAAYILEQEGIDARVIDLHTIKPIDREIILSASRETSGIITCEDHMITGGMGSAVAEVVTSSGNPGTFVPVRRLGIPDCYPIQGNKPEEVYAYYGYDAAGIVKAAHEMIDK